MKRIKVLRAGESWISASTHYKGFDSFGTAIYHKGAELLVHALADTEFDLTYMPVHEAAQGDGPGQYGGWLMPNPAFETKPHAVEAVCARHRR